MIFYDTQYKNLSLLMYVWPTFLISNFAAPNLKATINIIKIFSPGLGFVSLLHQKDFEVIMFTLIAASAIITHTNIFIL